MSLTQEPVIPGAAGQHLGIDQMLPCLVSTRWLHHGRSDRALRSPKCKFVKLRVTGIPQTPLLTGKKPAGHSYAVYLHLRLILLGEVVGKVVKGGAPLFPGCPQVGASCLLTPVLFWKRRNSGTVTLVSRRGMVGVHLGISKAMWSLLAFLSQPPSVYHSPLASSSLK